jgi:short-subunit dehydrogenase
MLVQNRSIVVTGAGGGIGRALVMELLNRGAKVAAVDINPTLLEETKEKAAKYADRLTTHIVDITDKASVETSVDEIRAAQGVIDGLINNAGIIQPFVKIADLDYAAIERVMNINFYGMLYMTKSYLPELQSRLEGHIVNISSMGGFLPVPGQTVYGASKAAVKLFTEGLWAEMMNTNVNVTVVFPGAIATNITVNSGVAIPGGGSAENSSFKALDPAKAAKIIVDAMEANKFRVCVGPDSRFLDFLYRLHPKFAAKFIAKQMASLLK